MDKNSTRMLLAAVPICDDIRGLRDWTVRHFSQGTNNANISPKHVTVSPMVSEYFSSLPASANQVVAAGQLLLAIDEGEVQARLTKQQASVYVRLADISRAETEPSRQQPQIDQAEAQLSASQIATKFPADQVRRYNPLAASGADTVEKCDQYCSEAGENDIQVEVDKAQSLYSKKQVDTFRAAVDQAFAGPPEAATDLDMMIIDRVGQDLADSGKIPTAYQRRDPAAVGQADRRGRPARHDSGAESYRRSRHRERALANPGATRKGTVSALAGRVHERLRRTSKEARTGSKQFIE